MDEITLRNPQEWRTAHVLQFNVPYNGKYVEGTIAYLRPYVRPAVNDEIDEAIINAIGNEFGAVRNCTLDYNTYRFNGNDVDRLAPYLIGNAHLEFVISFFPVISFGEAARYENKTFLSPRLNFNLSLKTNEEQAGFGLSMVTAELPVEHYEEYIAKINQVETR